MRRIVLGLSLLAFLTAGCSREKSTPELVADLKSPEEHNRIAAVRFLEQRKGDPAQVVPALVEALKDKEPEVRWGAANGLGYYGEQARDAIPALQAIQHDPDARVRRAVGAALARIDPKFAQKRN